MIKRTFRDMVEFLSEGKHIQGWFDNVNGSWRISCNAQDNRIYNQMEEKYHPPNHSIQNHSSQSPWKSLLCCLHSQTIWTLKHPNLLLFSIPNTSLSSISSPGFMFLLSHNTISLNKIWCLKWTGAINYKIASASQNKDKLEYCLE